MQNSSKQLHRLLSSVIADILPSLINTTHIVWHIVISCIGTQIQKPLNPPNIQTSIILLYPYLFADNSLVGLFEMQIYFNISQGDILVKMFLYLVSWSNFLYTVSWRQILNVTSIICHHRSQSSWYSRWSPPRGGGGSIHKFTNHTFGFHEWCRIYNFWTWFYPFRNV